MAAGERCGLRIYHYTGRPRVAEQGWQVDSAGSSQWQSGRALASGVYSNLEELIAAAAQAHAHGKNQGGNTVYFHDAKGEGSSIRKHDDMWVKLIESALEDNRFRLAQLPIAGLRSDADKMYDMLVRMIDKKGAAVLPSEFLPVADRNNLMTKIDGWIVSASIEFCAEHEAEKVFVKLSHHSMQESALIDWMQSECEKHNLDPSHLCVQIPEEEAAKYIKETKKTVEALRKVGIQFALEHYGIDKNRFQILVDSIMLKRRQNVRHARPHD